MTQKSKTKKTTKLSFVVSEEQKPTIELKPGMRLDVISVTLVEPSLKKAKAGAARLCGGGGTCLAIIDIEKGCNI